MKTAVRPLQRLTRLWAGTLAFAAGAATAEAASDRWATLEAIHKIENPTNSPRPGGHGELGAYQFRATTWRMHSSLPFREALDRQKADIVAVKHYEWLKRGLERARVAATPYNIALAWNSGLTAVTSGRAPRAAHDYAQRAVNLAVGFRRVAAIAKAQKTGPVVPPSKPAAPEKAPVEPRFVVSTNEPPIVVLPTGPRFVLSKP